jgi:hypothetical protein
VKEWSVENPWLFFGAAGAVVVYLLYMMIRPRKADRPVGPDREHEL